MRSPKIFMRASSSYSRNVSSWQKPLSQGPKPMMDEGRDDMEPRKVLIRSAQPKDAPVVAKLMYYAGPSHMLAFFGDPENKAFRVIRRMFLLPRHTTSYTYAFVAEDEGMSWDRSPALMERAGEILHMPHGYMAPYGSCSLRHSESLE